MDCYGFRPTAKCIGARISQIGQNTCILHSFAKLRNSVADVFWTLLYVCACVCLFRLVEFNCRLVCGLGVGEFNDLVTSSDAPDEPCRIVVVRQILDTTDESNSLSHDISQW